jgi:hypothetical protein
VNFVTCHDGFTLHDLVSYNQKHNEANLEGNRDGENNNHSFNHGVEGPTSDPKIRTVRERQKRNFLATVFLSLGVPMLYAGDEMGRSQRGNHNAYCQDNEISWLIGSDPSSRKTCSGSRIRDRNAAIGHSSDAGSFKAKHARGRRRTSGSPDGGEMSSDAGPTLNAHTRRGWTDQIGEPTRRGARSWATRSSPLFSARDQVVRFASLPHADAEWERRRPAMHDGAGTSPATRPLRARRPGRGRIQAETEPASNGGGARELAAAVSQSPIPKRCTGRRHLPAASRRLRITTATAATSRGHQQIITPPDLGVTCLAPCRCIHRRFAMMATTSRTTASIQLRHARRFRDS